MLPWSTIAALNWNVWVVVWFGDGFRWEQMRKMEMVMMVTRMATVIDVAIYLILFLYARISAFIPRCFFLSFM